MVMLLMGRADGAVRIVPAHDHLDQLYPPERTEETPNISSIWLSPSRSTGWTSCVRTDRTSSTASSGLRASAGAVSLAAACHGTWTGAGERERWRGWVRVVGVGVDEIVSGSSSG
jgi:hypothetical protein